MNEELKSDANLSKSEPRPEFIKIATSLAEQIGAYEAQRIAFNHLIKQQGESNMNESVDLNYFSEETIRLILDSSVDHCAQANLISGQINREIKKAKDAFVTVTNQINNLEKNYSEALGEIRALKFAIETLSKSIINSRYD